MLQFDGYELDEARRSLGIAGTRVPLEPRVFDLLLYLVRHRDRAVPHDEILRHVWSGAVVARGVLPAALGKLRRALNDDERSRIETVHGFGLRFHGDVKSGSRAVEATQGGHIESALPAITVLQPPGVAESSKEITALLCEELLVQLHRHRVLRVVPSEFVALGSEKPLQSALAARVRYALSASSRRTCGGFETSARLTDLAALRVVWSTHGSVADTDPGTAARKLAEQVAASLWTAFMLGRVEATLRAAAPDAWAFSCEGWRAHGSETWDGMRGSLAMFEAALQSDETNPWARVGRSLAKFTRHYFDPEQVHFLETARRDVAAVLEADPDSLLAQTHQSIYLAAAGQPEVARSRLQEAQAQSPELSWTAYQLANLDALTDPAHAIAGYDQALRLSGGGELRGRILTGLATAHRMLGDFEGSLCAARRAILARPSVPYGYIQAAASCGALGRRQEGHDLLRHLKKSARSLGPSVARAHVRFKEAVRPGYGEATLPFLRLAGWAELC